MAVKGMVSTENRGRTARNRCLFCLIPGLFFFAGTAACGDPGISGKNGLFPAPAAPDIPERISDAGRNTDTRGVAAGIGIRIRKNLPDVRKRLSGDLFRIASGLASGRIPEFNGAGTGVPGESPVPGGDAERPRIRRTRHLRIRHISGWDSEDEERAGSAAHDDVSGKTDEEQDD